MWFPALSGGLFKNHKKKRMKTIDKLPILQIESIQRMNVDEMKRVKGGFLSIGSACGWKRRRLCRGERLWTRNWGDYGDDCTPGDILN
jgi:hypothetical protein